MEEVKIKPVDLYLTAIDGKCRIAVLNLDHSRCKFISNDKILDITKGLHREYQTSPWQGYADEYLFVTTQDNSGKEIKLSPFVVTQDEMIRLDDMVRDKDYYCADQFIRYYSSFSKEELDLDVDRIKKLYSLFRTICGKDDTILGFKNDNRYRPMTLENVRKVEQAINKILMEKTNNNQNDIGFWEQENDEYFRF